MQAELSQKLDQTKNVGKDDTAESVMSAHMGEGSETQHDILISFPPTWQHQSTTGKRGKFHLQLAAKDLVAKLWFPTSLILRLTLFSYNIQATQTV